MFYSLSKAVGVLSLCYLSVACGGSGDSPGSGASPSDPTLGVNRGLTGTVAFTRSQRMYRLDLFTGKVTPYPRLDFDQDPAFHNLAKFGVTPIRGEQGGFVMAVDDCHRANNETVGCIVFMDKDAKTVVTYYLEYNIEPLPNKVSISPNGKYLSVLHKSVLGNKTINTYQFPDETLLTRFDLGVNSPEFQFDWSPSNSPALFYSRQDRPIAEIYIWDPIFERIINTISVPFEGYVGEVVVSPDGKQVAFEMINFQSSVYILDIKSLKFRRLVQPDETYPNQYFSNPEWSPDGKWILVEHDADINATTEKPGFPPFNLIAVPADAEDMVYHVGDESPDAMPITIKSNVRETLGVSPQGKWTISKALYWVSQ